MKFFYAVFSVLALATGASASMPVCDGRLITVDMQLEEDGDAYTFTSKATGVDFGTVTLKRTGGKIFIKFPTPTFQFKSIEVVSGGSYLRAITKKAQQLAGQQVTTGVNTLSNWYNVDTIQFPVYNPTDTVKSLSFTTCVGDVVGLEGCCSQNYKDCINYCGTTFDECTNCSSDVGWLLKGAAQNKKCKARYSACTNDVDSCCDELQCVGNQYYRQCLP